MKKIIMINGSPRVNGGTSSAFRALKGGMEEAGAKVNEYRLNNLVFKGCQACMACKKIGSCVIKDDLTAVLEDLKTADALVLGSPIYMFAISGQLSLFINRLYSLISMAEPGVYQPYVKRQRKYLSVYSMGNPSADSVTVEANRLQSVMSVLGFDEADRVILTSVLPNKSVYEMSRPEWNEIKERGKKFADSI